MATVDPTINDTMTRMQLRQIRQKLDEERMMRKSRASITPRTGFDEQNFKLQQAMLRRQELLDRIRQEKSLQGDLARPASYSARRQKYTRSPEPKRAESNPHNPTHVYKGESTPRQVIEHQFRPMRLDPLEQPKQPQPQPPPQFVPMAVPTPQMVTGVPTMTTMPVNPPNTKAEMMEMMMLQNAQMHQMIMNQMMIQALPKPAQPDFRSHSIDIEHDRRRPPSVHHHHYEQSSSRQAAPTYTLPPVQLPSMPYPNYPSPRYYPAELEPLKQPRVRKKKPRPKTPEPVKKKFVYGSLPFPGPWPLRKFRHAAYAVFFSKVLQKMLKQKGKGRGGPPRALDPDFVFGIKLKEVIAALHYNYLNTKSKVGTIFRQYTASNSRDLVNSVNSDKSSERKAALDDISYVLENVSYEMTEIMPASGVLGTHRKAIIVDVCRESKVFPTGYLWQIEKDFLEFDGRGRTQNIGDFESFMLVLGLFLGRGMITTLLLKPLEYSLVTTAPDVKAQRNLKLLATVMLYVYRKMLVPPKQPPVDIPYEIARFIHPDDEMKKVYDGCADSLKYAENLIRNWGQEYVERIRKVVAEAPIS